MVEYTEFKLEGVEKLIATLGKISRDVKYKSGRFALRKAANIVASAVKASARQLDDPQTSEQIAKNVTIRFGSKTFKRTGNLMFRVGLLGGARAPGGGRARRRRNGAQSLESLGEFAGKGKGNPGGDTFYWRFLEFGTERIAARPFMRPALANNIEAATKEFTVQFQKALDRVARRESAGA